MAEPLIIDQPRVEGLDAVTAALTEAFAAAREAVAAERPVVVLLADADLLGQGEVVDAAIAAGLLGLSRAFALEGAKPGWKVNAVSYSAGAEAQARETAAWVAGSGLSGQLLRAGEAHLGKVWP